MEGTGSFSPQPYLEVYELEPLGGEPAPLPLAGDLKGEAPMACKHAAARPGSQASERARGAAASQPEQQPPTPTPQPQRRLFCSSPRESRSMTDVSRSATDRARRQPPRSRHPDDDREAAARSLRLGRTDYNLAWQQPRQQQTRPPSGKKDTPTPTPRGDYTTPRRTLTLEREPGGDKWATTVPRAVGHWVTSSTSLVQSALPSEELRVRASSQERRSKAISELMQHGGQATKKEYELEPFQNLQDEHAESMIPARDKKIVNLMLERLKKARRIQELQQQAAEAWEEVKCCSQWFQMMMEKERQQQLSQSREQWERQKEERRARLSKEQQDRLETWEKEMALRESRWKRQVQEQESQRREKLERARVQAKYRKHCQEQMLKEKEVLQKDLREQNIQQLQEKTMQACHKKQLKNLEGRKKFQENLACSANHQFRKVLLDSQNKAEEILRRLSLEQRSQRSQEIHERLIEERHRELKEKAQKEEEHLLLAKWRAEETDEQKKLHKKMLMELGDLKIQQARDNVHKNIKDKADRIREFNFLREKNHYFLKQKAEEEAKCHIEGIKEAIKRKEQKMNQISREKDATIEESRKIAQTSFQMREKVKALQVSFDRMAWEAQFSASLHGGSN